MNWLKAWNCSIFLCVLFIVLGKTYSSTNEKNSNIVAKIAIVDVQTILEHSTAIQNIRKSINLISNDIQQSITQKDAEFKRMEEDIIKKREGLVEAEFNKIVADFNQQVSTMQQDVQNKKSRLEHAHSEAINQVQDTTILIISELAKKYGFNLAFPSSQILFAADELNLTEEIIKILNSRLKTVELKY